MISVNKGIFISKGPAAVLLAEVGIAVTGVADTLKVPTEFVLETTKKSLKECEKMSNWIPVKKDLPISGEIVLVTCVTKTGIRNVNRAYVDDNGVWHGNGSMSGVVAWMDMPEPYVEPNNETDMH